MKGLEGEASTELTLGLPGDKLPGQLGDYNNNNKKNPANKRGFCDAGLDLKLGSVENKKASGLDGDNDDQQLDRSSSSSKAPPPKEQLVGWPPVRPSRKNIVMKSKSKFVKVAVDGAPYLRKLDLQLYSSYHHLFNSLEHFFSCNLGNDGKLKDPVNGSELVPTYEDKDGDWMMVGDTPWKMFVESCQRIRFMKGSEAIGLGDAEPRTPSKVD